MQEFVKTIIVPHYNYYLCAILMLIGLWAMIAKNNLVKKVIGMNIFQTAIILFYISVGAKKGATIPILEHLPAGAHQASVIPADYINPLPHVLMLTAIVVSVATLGVALALVLRIYREHKTLEEDEILNRLGENT